MACAGLVNVKTPQFLIDFMAERGIKPRDPSDMQREAAEFLTSRDIPTDITYSSHAVLEVKARDDICSSCDRSAASLRACRFRGYAQTMQVSRGHLYIASAPCRARIRCEHEERISKYIDALPRHFRDKTFASFSLEGVSSSVASAARAAYDAAQDGASIIFGGSVGTGKTHLAASIVLHAIGDGKVGVLRTVPDLMDDLRALAERSAERQELMNGLVECDVLALDDLGAEKQTEWTDEMLFKLIDKRYLAQRPTIATTNFKTPEKLIARLGMNGERIVSRILSGGRWVQVEGQDRRRMRS